MKYFDTAVSYAVLLLLTKRPLDSLAAVPSTVVSNMPVIFCLLNLCNILVLCNKRVNVCISLFHKLNGTRRVRGQSRPAAQSTHHP